MKNIRGGSWCSFLVRKIDNIYRSSNRSFTTAASHTDIIGFRLVRVKK